MIELISTAFVVGLLTSPWSVSPLIFITWTVLQEMTWVSILCAKSYTSAGQRLLILAASLVGWLIGRLIMSTCPYADTRCSKTCITDYIW